MRSRYEITHWPVIAPGHPALVGFLRTHQSRGFSKSEALLGQSVPSVAVVCHEYVGRRAKTKAYYDNLLAGTNPLSMSPEQFAYTRPSGHHLGSYWGYGEVLEGSQHARMS